MLFFPHYSVAAKGEIQMKNIIHKTGCLLFAAILCFMACGCGKKEAQKSQITMPEVSIPEAFLSEVNSGLIPGNENLLTGLIDLSKKAIGKRPVAVMINNVEPALPQYGITEADIIFELPVEGNLTRLMALYADYTALPDICAIRSCRYYYPAIAKGFDAFYVHWGMDQTVADYVASLKMDRYDGLTNSKLFDRDSARRKAGYSLEHTGYFKGTQFAATVEKDGKRVDLLDAKKGTAFQFCELGTVQRPNGANCNVVKVNFGSASAKLSYDAETNLYYKDINGHAHVDGKTGQQLTFTNVFVLETSISVRDDAGHKKLDWAGSGSAKGYYISNGAVQQIRWSKANGDESAYLKFYDEQGKELVINRGKSYIAYTTAGKTTFE